MPIHHLARQQNGLLGPGPAAGRGQDAQRVLKPPPVLGGEALFGGAGGTQLQKKSQAPGGGSKSISG